MILRLPPYHPDPTLPLYDYVVNLGTTQLQYNLQFRPRRDSWYGRFAVNGVELCAGVRLVESRPLFWRLRLTPSPIQEGRLVLLSKSGDRSELGTQDGLGWTHFLWWYTPDEFLAGSPIEVTIT